MAYANYEQLKRGTEAPEWWVRQHALDVLIYLLGTEKNLGSGPGSKTGLSSRGWTQQSNTTVGAHSMSWKSLDR